MSQLTMKVSDLTLKLKQPIVTQNFSPIQSPITTNRKVVQNNSQTQITPSSKNSTFKFYQPIEQSSQELQSQKYYPSDQCLLKEEQIDLTKVFLKDFKQKIKPNKKSNQIILSELLPSSSAKELINKTSQQNVTYTPKSVSYNKNTSLLVLDTKKDLPLGLTHSSIRGSLMQSESRTSFAHSISEKNFIIKSSNNMITQKQQKFPSYLQNKKIKIKQNTLDIDQLMMSNDQEINSPLNTQNKQDFMKKLFTPHNFNESIILNQTLSPNKQKPDLQNRFVDLEDDKKRSYFHQNEAQNNKFFKGEEEDETKNSIQLFHNKNNNINNTLDDQNENNALFFNKTEQIISRKRNYSENTKQEQADTTKLSIFSQKNNNQNSAQAFIFEKNPQFYENKFKINLPSSMKYAMKLKEFQKTKTFEIKSLTPKQTPTSAKLSNVTETNIQKKRHQLQLEQNFSQSNQLGKNFTTEYFSYTLNTPLSTQSDSLWNPETEASPKNSFKYNKINLSDFQSGETNSFSKKLFTKQLNFAGSPTNKEVQEILQNLQTKPSKDEEIEDNKKLKNEDTAKCDQISYKIKKKQNLPFGDEIDKKKLSLQKKPKKENSIQTIQSEIITQQLNKIANRQFPSDPCQNTPQTPKKIQTFQTQSVQEKKILDHSQEETKYSTNQMNSNNRIFRQIVSQNQRKKLVPAQVRAALKKAIYYLRSLNITVTDLLTTQVFSSKPFQKSFSYEFIQAAKFGDIMKVRECLHENRYLVFDFDYIYQTALHWATKRNHKSIVQLLLQSGADVNCKDIMGRTPLYFAISQGYQDICLILLENKASPWSTEEINYVQLAKDNIKIISQLNKFKKINILISMAPLSKQQQLWEKQIQLLNY